MAVTMLVFALQDGLSRHLADVYSVQLVVMIRYWFVAGLSLPCRRGLKVEFAPQPAQANRFCRFFAESFWRWKSA